MDPRCPQRQLLRWIFKMNICRPLRKLLCWILKMDPYCPYRQLSCWIPKMDNFCPQRQLLCWITEIHHCRPLRQLLRWIPKMDHFCPWRKLYALDSPKEGFLFSVEETKSNISPREDICCWYVWAKMMNPSGEGILTAIGATISINILRLSKNNIIVNAESN